VVASTVFLNAYVAFWAFLGDLLQLGLGGGFLLAQSGGCLGILLCLRARQTVVPVPLTQDAVPVSAGFTGKDRFFFTTFMDLA